MCYPLYKPETYVINNNVLPAKTIKCYQSLIGITLFSLSQYVTLLNDAVDDAAYFKGRPSKKNAGFYGVLFFGIAGAIFVIVKAILVIEASVDVSLFCMICTPN